ncbi:MAG: HlyD family efflux transporter periplasmic adaptor subunit [Granulosicoccus sp.]
MPAIDRPEELDRNQTQSSWLTNVAPGMSGSGAKNDRVLLRAKQAEYLVQRQKALVSLITDLLIPTDRDTAVSALVEALKYQFSATRVALALVTDDGSLKLTAISDLHIDQLAVSESKLITDVMNECLQSEFTLCFPNKLTSTESLTSYKALTDSNGPVSVVTVPCYRQSEPVGVLLLERHNANQFDDAAVELLERLAVLAAPTLAFWCEAQRGSGEWVYQQWNRSLKRRFGSVRFGSLFLFVFFVGLGVITTLVPFDRHVSANAELVPQERRFVVAPFDGFIEELVVALGDQVVAGQLLAQLEQRELELESARRDSDLAGAESDFRIAMASHDRQATVVARANLDREQALRALIDQRLDRIGLLAPLAGLVVYGETAYMTGAPVRRGESLFEIAQADGYEVHILVHERDVREIHEGQHGKLSLRSHPGKNLDLTVHMIHPVAEDIGGISRYRVRAILDAPVDISPRPGESGIVELVSGSTNLLQLWGRPMRQHLTELWWRIWQ